MTILLSLAALAAAGAAVPATPAVPSRVVHHGDLDLTSAKDRMKLDRRLFRAAVEVCGEVDISHYDIVGQNAARRCRTTTVTAARAEAQARSVATTVRLAMRDR